MSSAEFSRQPALLAAKRTLRSRLRSWRRTWPAGARAAASQQICATVSQLDAWTAARVVLVYSALPEEVDLSALVAQAGDRTLAWPVVVGRGRALALREAVDLRPGPFGILEPGPAAPPVAAADVDLVVVPGVAFDSAGRRLGQGGGYYDRTLAGLRAARVGVCFHGQVVDTVPSDAHDLGMDWVVTERGVWVAPAGASRP